MKPSLDFVLFIAAFICFALAAVGVNAGRINLTALGLALATATVLV